MIDDHSDTRVFLGPAPMGRLLPAPERKPAGASGEIRWATLAAYFATMWAMHSSRTPVGIQWRQLGRWTLFVAAIAVIVAVLVGVSTNKPWLWNLFSP
jgi:hypothetical protein